MNFICEKNRIYAKNGDEAVIAEVTFPDIDDDTIDIDHTFVDTSLRGRGVAAKLMQEVAKFAKENNKNIIATCSYAKKWFNESDEYKDLIKEK